MAGAAGDEVWLGGAQAGLGQSADDVATALGTISYEVVTAARTLADALGGGVDAIAIGPGNVDATGVARYGADEIIIIADDAARLYQPHLYARAVVERAQAKGYKAIVLGATALGKDLAPRVAASRGVGLAALVPPAAPAAGGGAGVRRAPPGAGMRVGAFLESPAPPRPRPPPSSPPTPPL